MYSSSAFCLVIPMYLVMNLLYDFVGFFFKLTKQQLLQQNKPYMLQVLGHSWEPFCLMPVPAVHGPLVCGGQDMK